ncbi:hypothetical protein HYT01_02375 [Candidatus Giovannonibacteria bacterium]|nr:hypothetical protein [Candidatus Giovannonibacteria bacterium]
MGLIGFIEHLRNKPEETRKAITAAAVTVMTVIIVGIWLLTISLTPVERVKADAPKEPVEPSPFTLLWNMLKDAI